MPGRKFLFRIFLSLDVLRSESRTQGSAIGFASVGPMVGHYIFWVGPAHFIERYKIF